MSHILFERKTSGGSQKKKQKGTNRDPEMIQRELDRALKRGFQTAYGGSFFLIPYLLHLDILNKVEIFNLGKQGGIPVEKAVLALMLMGIIGKKRVNRAKNVTDPGIAAFAGMGKLPDQSFFHAFLDRPKTLDVEQFIIACSKRFKGMGLYKGKCTNLDRHFMGYFGHKRIAKDWHPTRNRIMRGVNASFTHDHETGDPVFVRADYPGLKPADVAIPMITTTLEILGDDMETVVFDKWFSVGALLDFINRELNIKYVTLLKLFQNRIKEMASIPADEFRDMADGRKIGFTHTNLRNYDGKARLVVVWFQEDGEDKYHGYLTNDEDTIIEDIVQVYSKRWGIENFFKELEFLNLDKLPSIELNKISMMLAMKYLGYCIVSCFRRDLGESYSHCEIESIFEEFLNLQALVQSKGNTIHVNFYRYPQVLAETFDDIDERFQNVGLENRVPWLNNKRLQFNFK